jgi:hypothetical protein
MRKPLLAAAMLRVLSVLNMPMPPLKAKADSHMSRHVRGAALTSLSGLVA